MKLNLNKNQYREYTYINREMTKKVIKARKNATQVMNGKKINNNISSKAALTLNPILNVILETGINELFASKSQLTTLLNTDKSNTNRDIKTYFKGYGLGEYAYSNKYNITINGEHKEVKRETHYYMYINKETLELMRDTMEIEGVDWDALIAQIPECERKCAEIGGKTETEINVLNYVDDEFIMKHVINVEKNLFTKEGHYSKTTSVINTNDNSVVEVSKKENSFIPKEEEIEDVIEEAVEEEYVWEQLSEEELYEIELEEAYQEEQERIEMAEALQDEYEERFPEEEEIEEQEEAEDLSISLSNTTMDPKDAYKEKCRQMQRSRVSLGNRVSVKPVERVVVEEEEEVEEEVVVEDVVSEEEVMSLLAEVKELQVRSKSRALAMKIKRIEDMLSANDRDLNDIKDQLVRYQEQFSSYENSNNSNNNTAPVMRRRTQVLGAK